MDYYLSDKNVFDRLWKEYKEHKSLIVALDFDLTIYDFHNEGYSFDDVISLIKECNKLNFRVVIFTANKNYDNIRWYCNHIGIKFDGININILPEFEGCGKIYYNILLDDRAGLSSSYNTLKQIVSNIKKEELK